MAVHTYIHTRVLCTLGLSVGRLVIPSRIYSTLRFKPENDISNNFIILMNVLALFPGRLLEQFLRATFDPGLG